MIHAYVLYSVLKLLVIIPLIWFLVPEQTRMPWLIVFLVTSAFVYVLGIVNSVLKIEEKIDALAREVRADNDRH